MRKDRETTLFEAFAWSPFTPTRRWISRFLSSYVLSISALMPVLQAEAFLRVSDNGRYLEYANGKPFFYLGDTAWELLHRLNREEADLYLQDRSEKGFTVIQTVALSEVGGLNIPNAYGHLPLIDEDPARPDIKSGPRNDYWDHVDYIVEKAESLGLTIGMVPCWGDKWQAVRGGVGPAVFTAENAFVFGEWLGNRYRDKPIIWILGGDRNIYSDEDRRIIESLAMGIGKGDGGRGLMSYHPRGPGLSSAYFHHAKWLDFNMVQSSHAARDHDNGLFIEHDYGLEPAKPTLDAEPRYEGLRVGFYLRDVAKNVYFDDYDVRQAAWWAVMAGSCGHTYGNGNVWQMYDEGREPILAANIPWYQAIDHPGAFQMGHLRRFMERIEFNRLAPSKELIVEGPTTFGSKTRALMADDVSLAVVYSPRGEPFMIDLSRFVTKGSQQVEEHWYDPRYGVSYYQHRSDPIGIQTYRPPSSGRGQDWALLLEVKDE